MKKNNSLLNSLPFQGKKATRGFTLVELIVVITILAILGTIAFISLQGYSSDTRDSVRISDLSNIDLQLELYLIKGTKLPIPDDAITLESNGVTVGYQGYIGEEKLNTIGVHGGGKDPLDDSYYTYRINGNQTTYQVMGFLEDSQPLSGILSPSQEKEATVFFPQTYAADLTKRYPITKGKTIGILLEQTTNKPLQQVQTGVVDLRNNTTNVDMYLSTTSIIPGTPKTLYGTMETLALNQNFITPKECPTGFIPVPGNRDLGQPAFCVAKYEMSYGDSYGDIPNSSIGFTNFNTVSFSGTKIPVSMLGKYPIADISQQQAIDSCKGMGNGYHLITNNEWMTIARDIEQQPINWSGGIVGENFIYNGISNELDMGCNINNAGITGRRRATKTGDTNCTNQRNKLILSNKEEIWDLSGNVQEHVNKANTLDGIDFKLGQTGFIGTSDGIGWDDDGIYDIISMQKNGSIFQYGKVKGMGNISHSDGVMNNIFLRGGAAYGLLNSGIYTSELHWGGLGIYAHIGFRCSF